MDSPVHPVNRGIAVKFDAVSFSYGGVAVLENASFHIHCGEFVALVGPNGSGKTTVLKLLLGLEQPSAGRIEIFGAAQEQSGAWRGRLGYVPQQPPADHAFPVTVRGVVRMGLLRPSGGYAAVDNAAIDAAMEQAGIAGLAGRSWQALSGGQRRRVLVARALASRPDILVLDEPTANMDAESESRLFEALGKLKSAQGIQPSPSAGSRVTILIVTHDTDFVSVLTDRVLCMGDDERSRRGIVQHRIEAAAGETGARRSGSGARVLHGETFPADECYEHG